MSKTHILGPQRVYGCLLEEINMTIADLLSTGSVQTFFFFSLLTNNPVN